MSLKNTILIIDGEVKGRAKKRLLINKFLDLWNPSKKIKKYRILLKKLSNI